MTTATSRLADLAIDWIAENPFATAAANIFSALFTIFIILLILGQLTETLKYLRWRAGLGGQARRLAVKFTFGGIVMMLCCSACGYLLLDTFFNDNLRLEFAAFCVAIGFIAVAVALLLTCFEFSKIQEE